MKLTKIGSINTEPPIERDIRDLKNEEFNLKLNGKELLYLLKVCHNIGGSGEFREFFSLNSTEYPNGSLAKQIRTLIPKAHQILDHLIDTKKIRVEGETANVDPGIYVYGEF